MLPALATDHRPPVSIARRSNGVRSFLPLLRPFQQRRNLAAPDKSARLSWLPAQGTMLSEDVRPQNPAQYLRGSSRRCPDAGQDGGVQAIIPRQETCRNEIGRAHVWTPVTS